MKEKRLSLKWKRHSVVAAVFLFSSFIEYRNMTAIRRIDLATSLYP
jgi:hypothetical protein